MVFFFVAADPRQPLRFLRILSRRVERNAAREKEIFKNPLYKKENSCYNNIDIQPSDNFAKTETC